MSDNYKELYDSAKVGLWRTTIDEGRFLNVNTAVAHILGYDDVEDLISHNATELYNREPFIDELKEVEEVEDFQLCMSKKDGSPIWVSISAKIHPEKGYIEGSIRDINDQKIQEQRFIPHLQKLSSLNQCIMNRLQDDVAYCHKTSRNKSLKIV